MVRSLLIRGMLVGLLAGLLVFGFGRVFGEPHVDRAIGFESSMEEAAAKPHAAGNGHTHDEPELVSRTVQAGIGLLTGVVVYAAAFGGLFALVFAVANGRMADLDARAFSALLAALGFIAVYVVPNLKYPANPPSVGQADTIGYRTALYFIMLALSVAAMVIAVILRRKLVIRHGGWNAVLAAAAFYLVVVVGCGMLLPSVDEVPNGFPATLLWQFRIASFGMQTIMWTTFGLAFGYVAKRIIEDDGMPMMSGTGE